jgi:hypothetical protein
MTQTSYPAINYCQSSTNSFIQLPLLGKEKLAHFWHFSTLKIIIGRLAEEGANYTNSGQNVASEKLANKVIGTGTGDIQLCQAQAHRTNNTKNRA